MTRRRGDGSQGRVALVSVTPWAGLPLGRGRLLACAALSLGFTAPFSSRDDVRRADAMALVRVSGDLNVRFNRVYKQPYVERDVEVATGSGFVIAPSGLVLTNRHVVSEEPVTRVIDGYEAEISLESPRIEVAIGPGGSLGVYEGAVVASDADLDLAVLQVTAGDLPYLPFGDSDAVEPGRPVQPGSSGGPMVDAEGYVVGVVRMKLARDATARGAGFGIPVNLVKDFLDAHGLLALMPVSRLRPGIVHSFDWKGLRVEMPDGFQDGSPSRLRVATPEVGDGISFRIDRLATAWKREALEEALLGGKTLAGFVPAAASPGRQLERGQPPRRVGSAAGTLADGARFRVEYAVLDLRGESVVARYLGPPDAVAFNLDLVRRSLETLEAGRLLTAEVSRPVSPALVGATLPGPEGGRVAMPSGWSLEPASASVCAGVPPAGSGLLASPQGDFTIVFRALRWPGAPPAVGEAVRACAVASTAVSAAFPSYAGRFDRFGVPMEARGVLVEREGESLLLEMEVPVAKLAFVEGFYDRWVREIAQGR